MSFNTGVEDWSLAAELNEVIYYLSTPPRKRYRGNGGKGKAPSPSILYVEPRVQLVWISEWWEGVVFQEAEERIKARRKRRHKRKRCCGGHGLEAMAVETQADTEEEQKFWKVTSLSYGSTPICSPKKSRLFAGAGVSK